jgi:hypothetical protein
LGMDLAGNEVLITVARPKMPQDKLDYIKVWPPVPFMLPKDYY